VQTAEGTFLVPFHEIQYIEANGNAPIIVTKAKTYRPRMTLDDMMRKLPRLTFLKTHRRFVVNLAHVRKYDERYLYFADSCKASISRDQRKEIIRAIKDYLR
jgi:DNA-binding LytR/AlgR family response regulator